MNNKWNKHISNILGSLWNRVYKDQGVIQVVKYVNCYLGKFLTRSLSVGDSSLYINRKSTSEAVIAPVTIPVSECLINMDTVSNYTLSGIVHKTSDIHTLSIPYKYVKDVKILQDSLLSPKMVWVDSINMYRVGEFVTLVVPYSYEFQTSVEYDNNTLTGVYCLHATYASKMHKYKDTFSVLCSCDLDGLSESDRLAIWQGVTKGVTQKVANQIVSSILGNDIAQKDAIVNDIWSECSIHYILTSDGSVYRGYSIPKCVVGDTVKAGDLLFTDVNVYDKNTVPDQREIPFIMVNTAYGPGIALNETTSPIDVGNGFIPDYGNAEWADNVAAYVRTGEVSMINSPDKINVLQYTMTTINPGSCRYYSITSDKVKDTSAIGAFHTLVNSSHIGADIRIFNSPRGYDCKSISIHSESSSSIHIKSDSISLKVPVYEPICQYV